MKRRYRGTVMLELLLLIPVMVVVAVCGVEFTRCLRYRKIAQSLSKEAANSAFRECGSLRTLQTSTCLRDVQEQLTATAKLITGTDTPSHVNITVFVSTGGSNFLTARSPATRTDMPKSCRKYDCVKSGSTTEGLPEALLNDIITSPSTFTNHGSPTPATLHSSNMLADQQILVVGEAFIAYQPLMGPVAGLFGYEPRTGGTGTQGFFMDATVI